MNFKYVAYGYVLGLGLALTGTITGLAVGNRYQRHALAIREISANEHELLRILQVQILYNRPAKQLAPHLDDPVRFQEESQAFLNRIAAIPATLQDIDIVHRKKRQFLAEAEHDDLQELLTRYKITVDRFYRRTEAFVFTVYALDNTPENLETAQRSLLSFIGSPEFAAFVEFSDQLAPFLDLIEVEEQTATAELQRAEMLRSEIILGSLFVSVIIAAAIAFYTIRQLGRQQTQLVQSEKMSSLGQLVAGVAHEINNPVSFIRGNLIYVKTYVNEVISVVQWLQQHYPEALNESKVDTEELEFIQKDLIKILNSMRVGSDRIGQIVLSLRNFSRLDESDYKAVDLHEGIESSLMILQHRLKAKANRPAIIVHREYGKLPPVNCYPGQLNQVVLNIMANAIDAIDERHAITTGYKSDVPPKITIRTSLEGEDCVEIAIADTGIGMTKDVCKKIFNPFFTTKPRGTGKGLGMSISYKIITETHHGKLDCLSTPGVGTEFFIRIPIHQQLAKFCGVESKSMLPAG